MKTRMIETLGEDELRLPALIEAGLAANDRLKFYFTLLQMAKSRADHPDQPAPSLKRERLAAGSDDSALDQMIATARHEAAGYRLPGLAHLLGLIASDLRIMAAPVTPPVEARITALLKAIPAAEGDLIEAQIIDQITRVDLDGADSPHRLVMELHKQLNTLRAGLAEQQIDGAAVFHLRPTDEPLVRAFMAGLNRTAPLKFGHPGLGTTVARAGVKLVIQNDIGTTDAHVIVIHIVGRKVTLTYSDVHLDRLQFFQALFDKFQTSWSGALGDRNPTLAGGETYFLTTAEFRAHTAKQLLEYLEFLGSRLVFLIDWNRARKQLRGFLRGDERIRLLRWAADNQIGHRGFLELGGARLINGAIETTAGATLKFGDRLCDVLGDAIAFALVQFAFQAASEGLLAHQSETLIRDRVRAELLNHLSTVEGSLLGIAADHAGLIFELTSAIRDSSLDGQSKGLAKRARRWEHQADQLVVAMAQAIKHRAELEPFRRIIDAADDAADDLEEAAFLLELLDKVKADDAVQPMRALAGIVAEAGQEWVKALGHAQHVQRHGLREDADMFLTAIDRLGRLEHEADDAERDLTIALLDTAKDFRALHLLTQIGHGLEDAADSLKRASLLLRDHVMGDVLGA